MRLWYNTCEYSGPNDPPEYPIIFLDIDGVLNSQFYYGNIDYMKLKEELEELVHFDPHAIQLLNRIIYETNAKVVYHTNWRYLFSKKELDNFLNSRGFDGETVGVVPAVNNRENNIAAWLNRYCWNDTHEDWWTEELPPNCPPFVAFDDMDWEFPNKLNGRFLWCDELYGITPQHVEKAIKLLGKSLTQEELVLKV